MRVAPLASTAVPAPTHREPSPAPAASSPSCVAFTIDAIASSHDALISAPHAPPAAGRSTTASRGAGIDQSDPRHHPVDQPRRDVVAVRRRAGQLARRLAQPRLVAQRSARQPRDDLRLRRGHRVLDRRAVAVDRRRRQPDLHRLDVEPGDPRRRRRRSVGQHSAAPAASRAIAPRSARTTCPESQAHEHPHRRDLHGRQYAGFLARAHHVIAAPARRRWPTRGSPARGSDSAPAHWCACDPDARAGTR
jgi:hypothetical protein